MKKMILATLIVLLFFITDYAHSSCETSIDGHQVCDFDITDWYGLLAAPAVSPAGAGRIYFDLTSGKFKCSENGGAFTNCVGSSSFTDNITITKANPSLIFDVTTATDTDFWMGVRDDAGSDDDDTFQIGDGSTPGTNPFLAINTSGHIGIGTTNPSDAKLKLFGSSTGGNFLASFLQNGITQENSAIISSLQNKAVTVQADGAAYFMGRDVTNDIEFIIGTSSVGVAFLGSMTAHDLSIRTGNNEKVRVHHSTGNIGIGTSNHPYFVALSGSAARTIGMQRNLTANTAGNSLTVSASSATSSATDKNGGDLILQPGAATGNGEAKIVIQTVNANQGAGTSDRNPATVAQFDENHLEFVGTAPTLSSCGTSPSISTEATDHSGKITVGSGSATSCTLNFNMPFTNSPSCFASNETTEQTMKAVTTTTTLVISSATDFASDVVAYGCLSSE